MYHFEKMRSKKLHKELCKRLIYNLESALLRRVKRNRVIEFGFGACEVYRDVFKDRFKEVYLVDKNNTACYCARTFLQTS